MKKFVALVLTVCLLMTVLVNAMAEAPLLQDGQPPVLVVRTNEADERIAAVILDGQNNETARIQDDGSLVLTDVNSRESADASVKERLTNAYLGLMKGVHYSDVNCLVHEHAVKVDIDTVLTSLGLDKDAYDLVMYELFDVSFDEEITAQLAEGCSVKLTLEVSEHTGFPMLLLYTPDGVNWQILPASAGSEGYTVQLQGSGTIALLCDGQRYLGIGQDAERTEGKIPGADDAQDKTPGNFTPSVSGKNAPQAVTREGENGESIVGCIRSTVSDTVIPVPDKNYVLITAVAERKLVMDIQTHEHLEWGYNGILQAEDVGELASDSPEGSIAADLDAYLQEQGLELTHDQLVVKDLFEVTAYGDYLDHLYDENNYLEITFDADLDPEKALVVIGSADSEHWHVYSREDVALNRDGSVTLRMHDLGAVAFLVETEFTVDAEGAVQAP